MAVVNILYYPENANIRSINDVERIGAGIIMHQTEFYLVQDGGWFYVFFGKEHAKNTDYDSYPLFCINTGIDPEFGDKAALNEAKRRAKNILCTYGPVVFEGD